MLTTSNAICAVQRVAFGQGVAANALNFNALAACRTMNESGKTQCSLQFTAESSPNDSASTINL